MKKSLNALISIRPDFAEAIISGTKTIELRRRIPSIHFGTRLWIYATRPVGAVIGTAIVEAIVCASPDEIWCTYGNRTGTSYTLFQKYFDGSSQAIAIFLENVMRGRPIHINKLRELRANFHPPQVLTNISPAEAKFLKKWSTIS